jgi:hypothetical protein
MMQTQLTCAQSLNKAASSLQHATRFTLGLPFDLARDQYARAVRAGLIENSMLASRNNELMLSALEKATLGPWARSV